MKLTTLLKILGIVVVAVGTAVVYLFGTPRLLETTPEPGAVVVPAGIPLRIRFSQPMNPASVAQHLTIDPPIEGQTAWEGSTLVFTPEGLWPSGQTIRVRLASGARAAGLLPLPLTESQSWAFTIGQPRLAYLYPSDGPADLYLLSLETGEIERLTDSEGQVLDYSLSGNGTVIFYNVSQGDGGSRIFRLDLLTRARTEILDCEQALCRYPQPSPDGKWLAYEQTRLDRQPDYAQVWLLSLGADAEPVLAGEAGHETVYPAWSPVGLLAFHDNNLAAFVLFDLDSGKRQTFPSPAGLSGVWSPDGANYTAAEIVSSFKQSPTLPDIDPINSSHLMRYWRAGGKVEDLTQRDDLEDASPAYSPDGKWLAFARKYLDIARWTPGRQLWVVSADGANARRLTNDPHYNHYEFAWHPDGRRIAFVRFNQTLLIEPPEIWLMHMDSGRTQSLITGGYSPQWIP